jgi:prevent-host-death family protein
MKTLTVGAFEAKNRLSELLVMAEKGQRIIITRRGREVAMLCAPESRTEKTAQNNIVTSLRVLRSEVKSGSETIKELIEEGRK